MRVKWVPFVVARVALLWPKALATVDHILGSVNYYCGNNKRDAGTLERDGRFIRDQGESPGVSSNVAIYLGWWIPNLLKMAQGLVKVRRFFLSGCFGNGHWASGSQC